MAVPSNPRQDIQRFLAIGGGSLDLLLDVIDGAQEPEAPPKGGGCTTARVVDLGSGGLPAGAHSGRVEPAAGGRFVAVFSAQVATKEAVMRAVEEDRGGLPAYFGPEEYADSARQLVETRAKHSWERFLRTERRVLEARRNGWIAKSLAWRLPCESQEELDTMASENRRRAEEGIVELRSEQGELSYKQLEAPSPEDHMDRIRAQLARVEWLLERRGGHIISPPTLLGEHESRNSA